MGKRVRLTDQQSRFCEEYMKDFNASGAARRAGYSLKSVGTAGPLLLKKKLIQDRLAELKGEVKKRIDRTVDDIVRDLIAWTQEAHDTGDLKTAMKGLELQLKRLGEVVERHEISGIDGQPVQQELVIRLVKPELNGSDDDSSDHS